MKIRYGVPKTVRGDDGIDFTSGVWEFLFCAIFFRIWKAKFSSQWVRFFARCLLIQLVIKTMLVRVSERVIFNTKMEQICKWNGTEVIKYLKTFKKYFFLEEKGFLSKKTLKIFKIAKVGKFFLECVSNGIIGENSLKLLNFGDFWKTRWVFGKNPLKFFKIVKCGKFFLECVPNRSIAWKSLFRPNYEVPLARN